jgi:type II secretory pathway pseudopilin PulG
LKNIKIKKEQRGQRGALLLELLVVIALLAVILSFSANAVFLSLRSNKISGERGVGNTLATESLEAVRGVSEENWQNIYGLTKSSQHYKTTVSGTKWILATGDETITLNNTTYTRYLTINNVSRDSSTRNIETSYVGADDDPGTQKITVTVSWPGGDPIVVSEYFFRWKNIVCAQNAWVTAGTGNTVELCGDATYDTKDAQISVTGGIYIQ